MILKRSTTLLLSDKPKGIHKLWFVGDDFMDETYRPYFKKARVSLYSKQNFEISNFSNTKRNSNNRIVISRILNTFVSAINSIGVLPRFVVFVIDDEVMNFIEYQGFGVSTLYGNLLEWLIKKVNSKVMDAKKLLPSKSVREDYHRFIGPRQLITISSGRTTSCETSTIFA